MFTRDAELCCEETHGYYCCVDVCCVWVVWDPGSGLQNPKERRKKIVATKKGSSLSCGLECLLCGERESSTVLLSDVKVQQKQQKKEPRVEEG